MFQLELLAPAKNAQIAIEAINHGADAVYMGAGSFGAREQASNSIEEIERVVNFAHLFNVKVYCTVNTIVFDDELNKVEDLIRNLWDCGVDAIIVQDVGVFEMDLPPMRFHMSTQANNRTLEQVSFWDKSGVSRVVLARELSISQIESIRNNTSVELEAFIHGSLCVSYSGNCYLSSDINHRSSNRGNCAQPCRLPYDLVDSKGHILLHDKHILSLGDLDATAVLADLIRIGVTSFKIEGRLKDSSYVKNITAHYSSLLDQFIEQNPKYSRSSSGRVRIGFEPDPERTFNRGTSTYFYEKRSVGLANLVSPKSLGKYIGEIQQLGSDWFSVDGSEPLTNGDGICYFANGSVMGTRIEGIEAIGYKPQNMTGMKAGTKIYRNRDHGFLKLVENSTKSRVIDIQFEISFTQHDIRVVVKSGNTTFLFNTIVESEASKNQDRAKDIWQTQFSKTGDSSFVVDSVVIQGDYLPHLAISKINELRRTVLEQFSQFLLEEHKRNRTVSSLNSVPYYDEKLTYQHNVANVKAELFFKKRGVKTIEPAFELEKPREPYRVMTTKYCVLYEMGQCKKTNQGKPMNLSEPLFLVHRERRYQLDFDCIRCEMIVKTEE